MRTVGIRDTGGPHVGFYGGINYGFGYGGVGFVGGMWAGNAFRYNTAVMNVNTGVVRNVYVNRTVVNNTVVNRASFNGEGGVVAQARPEEMAAEHEQHFQPTSNQISHEQAMSHDRNQLQSFNHGAPGTAAMDRVDGRRYNQQGRIAQGIGSGQLTPGETKNLESRESRLNGEVHNDRAANGGTLTPQERQQVNRQQNNLSRSIYNDKHNAATQQYGNNEVGQRRYNQQQRIANGVASGQMSPRKPLARRTTSRISIATSLRIAPRMAASSLRRSGRTSTSARIMPAGRFTTKSTTKNGPALRGARTVSEDLRNARREAGVFFYGVVIFASHFRNKPGVECRKLPAPRDECFEHPTFFLR